MSHTLISRSSDLKRLRDEGYDIVVSGGFLQIRDIPYLNTAMEVKRGIIVSTLELVDDVTPSDGVKDHTVRFAGDEPCDSGGSPLTNIINGSSNDEVLPGLVVNHSFSSKPAGGYKNYYDKMVAYIAMLENQAHVIDPTVSAKTFPLIVNDEQEASVFKYMDTASSRADISVISEKLKQSAVAIVGLGGTGAYVLDFVAKTPVKEIHIYDADKMQQHNAFRVPGALSGEEIKAGSSKVAYHASLYSKLRNGIVVHEEFIDASNVESLKGMDFIFLCLDDGNAKKIIVSSLEKWERPFIDVGMGIYKVGDSLAGIIRTTSSSDAMRSHIGKKDRIPFTDDKTNEYSKNIQIVELNALNGALAVIKWKKFLAFYNDLGKEHFSLYEIDGNSMINEDSP
jgi:hypothetical protein